jgi:parallel beta-helix repeat protein
VLAAATVVSVAAPPLAATATPERAIATVDCSQAAVRTVLTASAELDPTCTYTAGFEITASGVTLDCRGARVAGPDGVGGVGILIRTPVDVAMSDVTVRGCDVSGFTNAIKVTRDGFRTLPEGGEFVHPTSAIELVDNHVHDTRGVGIFVDGYVSGVTIGQNLVERTGSSGIYLETGSKQSLVVDNEIVDNGIRENGPGGQTFELGGTTLWFWGVGREGISIDGSYENTVRANTFRGNSAGGIFLYKNCGEYPDRNPGRWFDRRDHARDNLIEANTFLGGRNGVWVGSRMGENTLPMECSDPAYVDEPGKRVVLDYAERTTIRGNRFDDVTYAIRIEDDDAVVEGNAFTSTAADRHAVIVGTPYRTEVLGRPVRGTVLRDNVADIVGNDSPYRWVHGIADTVDEGNRALGSPSALCEGEPLPRQLFVMTIAVAPALPDGSAPPTPDLTVETVGALASCRASEVPPSTAPSTAPSVPAAGAPATPRPAVALPGAATYTG